MITNRQRYAERHKKICQRAEEEFVAQRRLNPRLKLPKTVARLSAAVRDAIKKRDSIAAVLATQAAHLALHASLD